MSALLDRRPDLDAVVAANDGMALGAMHTLRGRGLRIPEDVAVTGFDDIDEAAWFAPTLTSVGQPLEDLQYYQLGHGEQEALTLTERLGKSAVMVTDDFLALIIANRLSLSCQLFLDFVVGRVTHGELTVIESQAIVQAVSPRYPSGFVPHSLAMLRRLP